MPSVSDAYKWIVGHLQIDVGRFYGQHEGLSVGAGLLFEGVRYPACNIDTNLFQTRRGLVYVLTHECDVSQDNVRPYNEELLICPIIKFEEFVKLFVERYEEKRLKEFLRNLA
jgi:hypothetical protein